MRLFIVSMFLFSSVPCWGFHNIADCVNACDLIVAQCKTAVNAQSQTIDDCLAIKQKQKNQLDICHSQLDMVEGIMHKCNERVNAWYQDPIVVGSVSLVIGLFTGIWIML